MYRSGNGLRTFEGSEVFARGYFLTSSMRHPEPPDWINLFISVFRALFFSTLMAAKAINDHQFSVHAMPQWALMVFHSKLWELSLMACFARCG